MTVATVRIDDPITHLPIAHFDGELAGEASSLADPGQHRWVVLRAWKTAGGWMYGKAGMSRVYHTDPTPCRGKDGFRGSPAVLDDLPDDAVPCPVCRPLPPDVLEAERDAGVNVPVRYEFPRVEVTECRTPDYLIRLAATKRSRTGHKSVMLSGVAQDLVAQCMRDPDFRAGVRAAADLIAS